MAGGKPALRTPKLDKRVAIFPIIFFEVYLTVTVLLFAFGPWNWPVSNPVSLYSFLIAAQIALFVGYRSAIHSRPHPRAVNWLARRRLLLVSLLIGFAWLPQLYKTRTNQLDATLGSAFRSVATGLSDPAKQYASRFHDIATSQTVHATLIDYLSFFAYPILWLLFPLCVVYWPRLSRSLRIGLVIWIAADLLTWAAAGANKGFADYAMLLPWLLLAQKPHLLARTRWRHVLIIGGVALIGLSGVLAFFSANMLGRAGGQDVPLYDVRSGTTANAANPLLAILPLHAQGPAASFMSYLTQGYYALGLSLREPFVPCWGLGNSYFIEGLSRKVVNTGILDKTYPSRIQAYGWDRYRNWHSIYPWIASDLSFPGTILFMYGLGWLFASVWSDVVINKTPVAVSLFTLLLVMLFYIPANNQVLGFPGTATPFLVFLPAWLIARHTAPRVSR